eukprot:1050926-Pleurochrysis_carterae.AAC.1
MGRDRATLLQLHATVNCACGSDLPFLAGKCVSQERTVAADSARRALRFQVGEARLGRRSWRRDEDFLLLVGEGGGCVRQKRWVGEKQQSDNILGGCDMRRESAMGGRVGSEGQTEVRGRLRGGCVEGVRHVCECECRACDIREW